MVVLWSLLTALVLLCLYMAWALVYVHWPVWRVMDFFDTARRLGPVTSYLAIVWACVLLVMQVGPEWRLPPLVLAVAMTSVGITRDVKRERKKRKGSNG